MWRQLLDLLKQIKLIVIVRVIVRMIVIVIVEVYLPVAPGKHGFRGGERLAHPPICLFRADMCFSPVSTKIPLNFCKKL